MARTVKVKLPDLTKDEQAKELDGITATVLESAKNFRSCDYNASQAINLALLSDGEALADRLGQGFDWDVLAAWEARVRTQYQAATA